ncbi:MAG TPA: large conductance mechanosensitive channel protein MscL [Pseudonocardiaceae bacterium]|jgi:large conductance mechanosensitive channel|nr:large conductance mechanosensitive channel protein MscL [Pseudonocardiaceae bacterium]
MLKGFKAFVLRGNIFDLAVAVVIGTAFTAVVTAVVTNLINPLIAAIGGANVKGLAIQINANNPSTVVHFDTVITAVINFVVIAAVVYFAFVMPVQRILARRKGGGTEADEIGPTDVELLTEIRDLLREQRSGGAGV